MQTKWGVHRKENHTQNFWLPFNGLFLLFQEIKWKILSIISSSASWIDLVQLAELCVSVHYDVSSAQAKKRSFFLDLPHCHCVTQLSHRKK